MTEQRAALAVLISGRGSNMLRLLDAVDAGTVDADVALVLADNTNAAGLALAAERGIPTRAVPRSGFTAKADWEQAVDAALREHSTSLVALAGFMRVLSGDFCARWDGSLLNIHPSLLPRHKGLDTHQRALDAGDSEAGCSVHFVTAELDGGPVIAQARVTVEAGDTAETLAARVLTQEHLIYPQVVSWVASGRVSLYQGAVQLDGRNLSDPIAV